MSGSPERHAGFVYADNDDSDPWRGNSDSTNPIEGISTGRGNRETIDVDSYTFTRDFVNPDRFEEGGYHYIIDEEDIVRVP